MKYFIKFDQDLHKQLSRCNVSLSATGLFFIIASHTSYNSSTAKISQNELVKQTGSSKQTVNKLIKELVSKGFITLIKHPGKRAYSYDLNGIERGKKSVDSGSIGTETRPMIGTETRPHHARVNLVFRKKENNNKETNAVDVFLGDSESKPKKLNSLISSHPSFSILSKKSLDRLVNQFGESEVTNCMSHLIEQYKDQKINAPGGLLFQSLKDGYCFEDLKEKQREAKEKAEKIEKERLAIEHLHAQLAKENEANYQVDKDKLSVLEKTGHQYREQAEQLITIKFPKLKGPFRESAIQDQMLKMGEKKQTRKKRISLE